MGMVMQWDVIASSEVVPLIALDEAGFGHWLDRPHPLGTFDVDKMWQAVHAVLTGTAWSTDGLGQVVLGGAEFCDDLGYGPPRLLTADSVRDLSTQLDAIAPADFRSRIDFDQLAAFEVYPTGWDRASEHDALRDELTDAFGTIRSGFGAAAAAGHSIVVTCL